MRPHSPSATSFVLVLVVLLATAPVVGPAMTSSDTVATTAPLNVNATNETATTSPEIVAIYPNPATDGDVGEFVVVQFSNATDAGVWSLDDGETNASLPNVTVSGRVAVSPEPSVARNRTDLRVLALGDDLSLANGGETVRLISGNTVTNTATYDTAPEGERWHRTEESDWEWTPLGATDFEVERSGSTEARAFVLPDAPEVPLETLRQADRRILLAGYTFTSERTADTLAAAATRGVEVRVVVDDAPVGGLTSREATVLDSLVDRGVEVRVLSGSLARYRFHHAKYAVADDRALVLTENWKPSGVGGNGSRGWGVTVRDEATAERLAAVFRADTEWHAAVPWSEFRRGEQFVTDNQTTESYPTEIPPKNISVESAAVVVAPDNAESEVLSLLDSANESIRVQQVAVGSPRQSFLRATLRAARRGVEVRLLLSSAWYVEEDNRKLVEWVNERAETENLPIKARLADPRGRYEKIHAKGVVVDGNSAVVGSMNWNNNSARENREVGVILRGEAVGGYYATAFDSDWEASRDSAGEDRIPVGLLAAVLVGALAAILYASRTVTFEKRA